MPSDPPVPAPLTLPEQFGPYRILRPLGKGGMGAIYLARDTRLDRNVALKVCHLADNPRALERFRREAKAAAALRHPNLCPVHEFDVRDGIAYLTMDFIDGPTLAQWGEQHPLNQIEAAMLVAKLALAMQAAHDKGVIHRDLKPANIVLDEAGEPVILDFGLARVADARTKLTRLGAVFGTPSYMAPEQAQGDTAAVGPATDQYSLGVILYELLTDHVPFVGPPMILLFNSINTLPELPSKRNPTVDVSLEAICLRTLAKKPEDRYPTLKAFAEELTGAARKLGQSGSIPRSEPPPLPATAAVTQCAVSYTPTLPPTLPSALVRQPRPKRPAGFRVLGRRPLVLLLASLLGAGGYGIYRLSDNNRGSKGSVGSSKRGQTARSLEPDPQDKLAPRTNTFGMTFVRLPKATFYMGWDGQQKGTKTEIKEDFEIAVHTVTQGQWQEVMGDNPSFFSRNGNGKVRVKDITDADLKQFPVENVSWDMVQEFVIKLNKKERGRGWLYRLPTEVEWEYACRGGATSEADCSYHFYFDKPTNDISSEQANFEGNFPCGDAPKGKYLERPTMVGSYKPNKLGLYDMTGNVWQWCQDLYGEGRTDRVVRGGGWPRSGSYCRAAFRGWSAPSIGDKEVGCRLVRVPSGGM